MLTTTDTAQADIATRPYLTPAEAAAHLSIPVRTLEGYRKRGGGPVYRKLGRKTVRYHRDDLTAWAEAGKRRSVHEC
ncbi:helix-turn-helix domain-containing protein [Methylobacterium durans]|uniref:helix-turn-helix transcriptional regulator n=1 Tax=Methylobacterium durans TaxID=2202825 RepID=UPI002AFE3DBB|nr:helix-turn-helix domain-containing protein [Methylobacterium durans]MEA1833425.1 helix-turn-helix domain-containing protein [Methylobacterium durans]